MYNQRPIKAHQVFITFKLSSTEDAAKINEAISNTNNVASIDIQCKIENALISIVETTEELLEFEDIEADPDELSCKIIINHIIQPQCGGTTIQSLKTTEFHRISNIYNNQQKQSEIMLSIKDKFSLQGNLTNFDFHISEINTSAPLQVLDSASSKSPQKSPQSPSVPLSEINDPQQHPSPPPIDIPNLPSNPAIFQVSTVNAGGGEASQIYRCDTSEGRIRVDGSMFYSNPQIGEDYESKLGESSYISDLWESPHGTEEFGDIGTKGGTTRGVTKIGNAGTSVFANYAKLANGLLNILPTLTAIDSGKMMNDGDTTIGRGDTGDV